ncbi:uncharacterized protein LOC134679065 [Cydia fagiglandana]|uniref:uncharacterized protein LOC134679065 n=1 Tax=Cydia fagiglandana TaxID=1458189 RepID=UPI002FEE22E2
MATASGRAGLRPRKSLADIDIEDVLNDSEFDFSGDDSDDDPMFLPSEMIRVIYHSSFFLHITGDLQAVYDKMKEAGKNSVDGIVQWFQESKIIDKAKENEEKVRSYFANESNKNDISADKFKEVVGKVASDQKKNVGDLAKNLQEYAGALGAAVQEGASKALGALGMK